MFKWFIKNLASTFVLAHAHTCTHTKVRGHSIKYALRFRFIWISTGKIYSINTARTIKHMWECVCRCSCCFRIRFLFFSISLKCCVVGEYLLSHLQQSLDVAYIRFKSITANIFGCYPILPNSEPVPFSHINLTPHAHTHIEWFSLSAMYRNSHRLVTQCENSMRFTRLTKYCEHNKW